MQSRMASAGPTNTAAAQRGASVKCTVYGASRKGNAAADGNGHASPTSRVETVILSPSQTDLMNNNSTNDTQIGSGSSVVPPGLALPIAPPGQLKKDVFQCPEESLFYSQCIEAMVLSRPDCPSDLVEFGAGDGAPAISALLKSGKAPAALPTVSAFEISPAAARLAATHAAAVGLQDTYVVHNTCFWAGAAAASRQPGERCLIANPPYLPAPDASQLLMPALWGGQDGANLTRDLLSAGFGSAMLLISGYSHPALTLAHARDCGYAVTDFLVQPLPFGTYTSQDVVVQHLAGMRARGQAFYRDGSGSSGSGGVGGSSSSSRRRRPYYFLAGVMFERVRGGEGQDEEGGVEAGHQVDLMDELLSVLTAL